MTDLGELLLRVAIIGVGGAALMDAWALFARRRLNVQGLDYALIGRWIGPGPGRRISRGSAYRPILFEHKPV